MESINNYLLNTLNDCLKSIYTNDDYKLYGSGINICDAQFVFHINTHNQILYMCITIECCKIFSKDAVLRVGNTCLQFAFHVTIMG